LRRVFISDCEGPISKNDNAFELTSSFVPVGRRLFFIISRYDDVLADVAKRPGYKAGGTLRLVLPFLKAYGMTDQKMREFSTRSMALISDAGIALQHIRSMAPAFIVSTSYEHYVKALCQVLEFPFENTYCTRLSIDKYVIIEKEKTDLKRIAQEIADMQTFDIPSNAEGIGDLPERDQMTIGRLDELFWEVSRMEVGKMYSEITAVGGVEKAEAVKDIVRKLSLKLSDVMYVGDSITDEETFVLVRENGGLVVSFNGNRYAVKNADVAVLSESSILTAVIADSFVRFGKQSTLDLVGKWSFETLKKSSVDSGLLNCLVRLYPDRLPRVERVSDENLEALAKESVEFRRKVRGEAIGRLG
jgi:energy-converting hydrogenase A subunit R